MGWLLAGDPAWGQQHWRDRQHLQDHCRVNPYARDCRNLEDPKWQPIPLRCTPTRQEMS